MTPVPGQPGQFTLTLSGINYDLLNVPELDSFGNPLPTDWDYVASGMVWFRVLTNQGGSVSLSAWSSSWLCHQPLSRVAIPPALSTPM